MALALIRDHYLLPEWLYKGIVPMSEVLMLERRREERAPSEFSFYGELLAVESHE
jgi:hypothetical protein